MPADMRAEAPRLDVKLMRSSKDEDVRQRSASVILDRAYGRPGQTSQLIMTTAAAADGPPRRHIARLAVRAAVKDFAARSVSLLRSRDLDHTCGRTVSMVTTAANASV